MRKIVSTLFSSQLVLDENCFYNIIIENPDELFKFVVQLKQQLTHREGNLLTLSEDNNLRNLDKYAYFVEDVFKDLFNDRTTINSIYKIADKELLISDLQNEFSLINNNLISFLNKTKEFFDLDLDFSTELYLSSLYKMFKFKPLEHNDDLLSKLVQLARMNYELFDKDIMITLNLEFFMNNDKVLLFISEMRKLKVNIINIQAVKTDRKKLDKEVCILLDRDICEILS
jgi:CRISPR type II-A-associated protein Csn2